MEQRHQNKLQLSEPKFFEDFLGLPPEGVEVSLSHAIQSGRGPHNRVIEYEFRVVVLSRRILL